MSDNVEKCPCLSFKTEGTWTSPDVLRLVSSAAGIYDAFQAIDVIRKREQQYEEMIEHSMQRAHKYMDHPMYHDMYHMWRDYYKMWRKERVMLPFPPMAPFQFPMPGLQGAEQYDSFEIFEDINSYVPEEDRLLIRRIRVSSPGTFSFSGSGEIVKEIRELIKDLWFRNSQERARGELDILEKYLTIRRDNSDLNLPPPTGRRQLKLVKVVREKIGTLRQLESQGKLKSIPEHIEDEE